MTWQEDAQKRYQQDKAAREAKERQQFLETAQRQSADLIHENEARQARLEAARAKVSGSTGKQAEERKENANGTLPLSEQEQRDLIALFQAFLKLKNTELRLHFYTDTGGGLTDTSGATKNDEKLIAHWLDMSEGRATIEAMVEAEREDEE